MKPGERRGNRRGSLLVALGILLSRIFGVIRQRVLAHYLGLSNGADILSTAFRIPNVLQNLLGEGALSASFIPSYSRLLGEGKKDEARRLANAVLSLLLLAVAVIVLVGELTTPWLVQLLVYDWPPEKQFATAQIVRILFPGVGLMVISAWCLGVLNSHSRFLLSYSVGVVWNVAIIAAVIWSGHHNTDQAAVIVSGHLNTDHRIITAAAWGAVIGSLLQIVVQWPVVRMVGGQVGIGAWRGVPGIDNVVRAFFPNLVSRGANQISAWIDLGIASYLREGTVAALTNAQVIYTLPVSLFGMAVSAAELPEMSRERGDPESVAHALRIRLDAATQRLAFYIVPSAAGFLCLGGVIAAAIYQTRGGKFTPVDSEYLWLILAGSAIGLLASTLGRLYASTFYALGDTKTPLRCGLVRVGLTGALGWVAALVLPRLFGWPANWGAAALTASAGAAGWIEFILLRRGLIRRLGNFDLPTTELLKLWVAAVVAGIVSTLIRIYTPLLPPIPLAILTVSTNAIIYLGVTMWWDVPEAAVLSRRIQALVRR